MPRAKERPTADDTPMDTLLAVMRRLRDPQSGCKWDIAQTFESIKPHTIEEAYEVADAIERADMDDLKDELGDLLMQVVFHARMAEEAGYFDFNDVAGNLVEKLVFRHPHVFGDQQAADADAVVDIWEAQKAKKRTEKGALAGVTRGLPALLRAHKLQKRAARQGFTWPDAESAWDKVEEEYAETKAAIAGGKTGEVAEELGDLMFCLVNYARLAVPDADAEELMRRANTKFTENFNAMEAMMEGQGRALKDTPLEDMLGAWKAAKVR